MNWLDFIIGVLLVTSVVSSIVRGLTRELISLAALVFGILGALWWYPEVGRRIEPHLASKGVAAFVGFLVVLFAFLIVGALVSKIVGAMVKAAGLRWADRILGAAFGLVRGVLASAVLVMAIVAFLHGPGATQAVARSRLAPTVLYGARALAAVAPRPLREGFEQGLQSIRQVWRNQTDTV